MHPKQTNKELKSINLKKEKKKRHTYLQPKAHNYDPPNDQNQQLQNYENTLDSCKSRINLINYHGHIFLP